MQPAASAGPTLRVIIAIGKFHGVMQPTTPMGSLMTTIRLSAACDGIVSPYARLPSSANHSMNDGAIDDLAARLGERLALLERHQPGQVVLAGENQLVPAAQNRGALLGGALSPGGIRGRRGIDGFARFGAAELRHDADDLAGGGIVDRNGRVADRRGASGR